MLTGFARILEAGIRKSDLCGRWGGEEFVVLLTNTTVPGSILQAERIRRAGEVYREYRFSLLLPASLYDPEAEPEDELMLQGVVDCAFRTEQGLVIVDFKTDRILPQEAAQRAELYRPQLTAYSQALSRVLEAPVAERVLYFFGPGCQVTL